MLLRLITGALWITVLLVYVFSSVRAALGNPKLTAMESRSNEVQITLTDVYTLVFGCVKHMQKGSAT